MKAKKLLSIMAILFIALISGCANDDFEEVVGVCPVVLSTNPIDGAFGVPLRQIITATFNEEMNPSTINQSSIHHNGSRSSCFRNCNLFRNNSNFYAY